MEESEKITVRLPFLFKSLREEPVFNDCILKMKSGKEICTMRLLLAKNSKWFERYFETHDRTGMELDRSNAVVVNIGVFEGEQGRQRIVDFDDQTIEDFVDLLYSNYIKMTVKNIPRLLKVAVNYEFTTIAELFRRFYLEAANDKTLLYFVSEFIENDLISDAKSLAPKIAQHLIQIERNDPNECFTTHDIYKALNPSVFATVLIEKNNIENKIELDPNAQSHTNNKPHGLYLYEPGPPSQDIKNIRYIEDFVKFKGTLTNEDKEDLAKVVDWDSFLASKYLLQFPCDWLPGSYSRKTYQRIFLKRKRLLRELGKELKKCEEKQSRWYSMGWLRTISNIEQSHDEVPIVEFIRTFGGITKPFDPVKYGLLEVESSAPLIKINKPENAFIRNDDLYFMSRSRKEQPSYISFNLGPHVSFRPVRFYLNSHFAYRKSQIESMKAQGKEMLYYAPNKGIAQSIDIEITNNKKEKKKYAGISIGSQLNNYPTCSEIKVSLSGETTSHSDLFRITEIDFIGSI